jgi:hypothetical protein
MSVPRKEIDRGLDDPSSGIIESYEISTLALMSSAVIRTTSGEHPRELSIELVASLNQV